MLFQGNAWKLRGEAIFKSILSISKIFMVISIKAIACKGVCKVIDYMILAIKKIPGVSVYIVFTAIGVIVGYGLSTALFTKNEFHILWFAGWIVGLSAVIWPFARIEKSVFDDEWSHNRIRKILKLFFLLIIAFALAVLFFAARLSCITNLTFSTDPIGRQISAFYELIGDRTTVWVFALLSALHIVFFLCMLYQIFLLSLPQGARRVYSKGMEIGILPKF